MSLGSRLMESKGFLLASVFYIIVAVLGFVLVPMTSYPPHIAIIAMFSLAAGYGLLVRRNWALYLVVILFLMATVLSAYMLLFLFAADIITTAAAAAYLILTWIATAYVAIKRAKLVN